MEKLKIGFFTNGLITLGDEVGIEIIIFIETVENWQIYKKKNLINMMIILLYIIQAQFIDILET